MLCLAPEIPFFYTVCNVINAQMEHYADFQ